MVKQCLQTILFEQYNTLPFQARLTIDSIKNRYSSECQIVILLRRLGNGATYVEEHENT